MIDHDRLFKELITTFFVEFLERFVPGIIPYLDPTSIVFLDKEVFTDIPGGERRVTDIVAQATFKGQTSQFLVHLEHQARPEEDFDRRLFQYFTRLHEEYALPVYPIALFSDQSTRRVERDTYRVVCGDIVVLEFRYRVIQLRRLNWRDFVQTPNPVVAALMAKMKMQRKERPLVKLACLRMLSALQLVPAQRNLLTKFIDTYLRLNEKEQAVFQEAFRQEVAEKGNQEAGMEIMTSWERTGIQEGKADLVLRLLRRRCGGLDAMMEERIQLFPASYLDELFEAAIDFTSRADLERWLRENPATHTKYEEWAEEDAALIAEAGWEEEEEEPGSENQEPGSENLEPRTEN